MSQPIKTWIAAAALPFALSGQALAQDHLAKDLTSTIALLGLPCGQVVSAQRLKDNDYIAVCKDKNRYRVYINKEGRVVAQKQ